MRTITTLVLDDDARNNHEEYDGSDY